MTGNSLQAVKINIDVGEGFDDATLVPLADQVNIACGGHCGDEDSILQALELAARWGVAAGAHPSYPDRVNFGRLRMNLATSDLMDAVAGQLARITRLAQTMGVPLTHIKPHGALYHALYREADLAKAFVGILPRSLSIITMPGGCWRKPLAILDMRCSWKDTQTGHTPATANSPIAPSAGR